MDSLFIFPGATRQDPAVFDWMGAHAGELGTLAALWFQVMKDCGDDVNELLHDGHPTACVGKAAFAYVNVFRAHVNIGFYQGAELPDPDRLLQGAGKRMRHVKIRPGEALNEPALNKLISDACQHMREQLS